MGYAGWVENVVDCRFVTPEVDLRDSTPCKSMLRRNVRIKSNRKVPQTIQLSLGVLDMDGAFWGLPRGKPSLFCSYC